MSLIEKAGVNTSIKKNHKLTHFYLQEFYCLQNTQAFVFVIIEEIIEDLCCCGDILIGWASRLHVP